MASKSAKQRPPRPRTAGHRHSNPRQKHLASIHMVRALNRNGAITALTLNELVIAHREGDPWAIALREELSRA